MWTASIKQVFEKVRTLGISIPGAILFPYYSHTLKLINMSIVSLTPTEFLLFKSIAHFSFDFSVKLGIVYVIANTQLLAQLGY